MNDFDINIIVEIILKYCLLISFDMYMYSL